MIINSLNLVPLKHLYRILFLMAFVCPSLSYGQEFQVRYFGVDQGLPTSYVYDLISDDEGYLWVGTDVGAFRFDGYQFTLYDTSNGMAGQFISVFEKDRQGRVWAGDRDGGVSVFEGNKFETVLSGDTINSPVVGISEGPLSSICIATANGIIRKVDPNGNVKTLRPRVSAGNFTQFCGYAYGSFLVGTESGLFVLQPEVSDNFIYQIPDVPKTSIRKIAKRRNGNGYWVVTDDFEVFFMEKDGLLHKLVDSNLPDIPEDFQVRDIVEWNDSTLLVSSYGQGVYILKCESNLSVASFQRVHGWDQGISEYINSVWTTGDGPIWLGSFGHGLYQVPRPFFSCLSLLSVEGKIESQINSILHEWNNRIWIATTDGLFRTTTNRFRNGAPVEKEILELRGKNITGLTRFDQKIYVGTQQDGLYQVDPTDNTVRLVPEVPQSHHIQSIASDHQGTLWIGTHGGLWSNARGTNEYKLLTVREGLAHNSVLKISPSARGGIYVILQGGVAGKIVNGKFEKLPIEDHVANSIFEDKDGVLWLGTEGRGIIRYDGNESRNYTINEGVPSNFCTVLYVEDEGIIWATRDREVYRLHYDAGASRPVRFSELSRSHDVISDAFLGMPDGECWLGTAGGFLRYSPHLDHEGRMAPTIRIVSAEVNGKVVEANDSISLDPGTYSLRVAFRGVELGNPHNVIYKFILEGNDETWSKETNSGEVVYPNLADGEYTFKVLASNGDGLWSEMPATIRVHIATPFWKQIWFIALCTLTFLLALFLTIRIRTIKLQQDKQRLEQIVAARTAKIQKQQDEILRMNEALEVALQGSNARNQALLEAIPDLLFAVKPNGDITEIMGTAQKPETPTNVEEKLNIFDMIGADNQASCEEAIKYVAVTRESHQVTFQMNLSGESHHYEARLAPLGDEEVLFLARDITWRILYEKEKQARQKESSKIMIQTQESERERFAKDLHDGIGQLLSATKLNVMSIEGKIMSDLPDLMPQLQNIKKLINDSIQEARGVSHDLMPPMLKDFGLRMALEDLAQKINMAGRLKYTFKYYGPDDNINDEIKRCVFRVIQEITNNIMKHAKANRITVQVVNSGEELIISVEDDGIGFNIREVLRRKKGLGLYSIRNRIRTFDGFLEIDSRPGAGTLFSFEIPLNVKVS